MLAITFSIQMKTDEVDALVALRARLLAQQHRRSQQHHGVGFFDNDCQIHY
jgi:hypothetical protein